MLLGIDRVETIAICLMGLDLQGNHEIQEAVKGVAPPVNLRVGFRICWLMTVSRKIATVPITDSIAMLLIVGFPVASTGNPIGESAGVTMVPISTPVASELADLLGSTDVRVLVASAKTILVAPNDFADWALMCGFFATVLRRFRYRTFRFADIYALCKWSSNALRSFFYPIC